MRIVFKTALAIYLAAFCCEATHAQEKMSLKQAIDSLLKNNIQLKKAALDQSLADENLQQSKNALLPTVSAIPEMYLNSGRSVDPITNQYTDENLFAVNGAINAQAVLYQGNQRLNQIKQNKALLDAGKSNYLKLKDELTLNVLAVYIAILNYQDLLSAYRQQLQLARFAEGQVQRSFDEGFKTQADLTQAKAQTAAADYNVTTAASQSELSLLSLKQLMKIDPQKKISVEKPDSNKMPAIAGQTDADAVLAAAFKINPEIQRNERLIAADSIGIDIAKGAYYPKLAVFGNVGSGYSSELQSFRGYNGADTIGFLGNSLQPVLAPKGNAIYERDPFSRQLNENFYFSAGLYLQIPILNGFEARSAVKKAKIVYEEQKLSAQDAKTNLNEIIYKAIADLKEAAKKYASAQASYNASKDAFNSIQRRFATGFANQQEYNTALTGQAQAQSEMIRAQYELLFKSKVIDFYEGIELDL